jgi:TolB-like protein
VDCILEGSVRCADRRARVTVQLIEVGPQTHLWSENYDCELVDVLAVQSDIAARIRHSLAALFS